MVDKVISDKLVTISRHFKPHVAPRDALAHVEAQHAKWKPQTRGNDVRQGSIPPRVNHYLRCSVMCAAQLTAYEIGTIKSQEQAQWCFRDHSPQSLAFSLRT